MASFDSATKQYAAALDADSQKNLLLPDKNYDTGAFSTSGVYRLNDVTHAFWLHKLAAKKFTTVTPEIRKELVDFYRDPNAPNHTKQKPDEWKQTLNELAALKQ